MVLEYDNAPSSWVRPGPLLYLVGFCRTKVRVTKDGASTKSKQSKLRDTLYHAAPSPYVDMSAHYRNPRATPHIHSARRKKGTPALQRHDA